MIYGNQAEVLSSASNAELFDSAAKGVAPIVGMSNAGHPTPLSNPFTTRTKAKINLNVSLAFVGCQKPE